MISNHGNADLVHIRPQFGSNGDLGPEPVQRCLIDSQA